MFNVKEKLHTLAQKGRRGVEGDVKILSLHIGWLRPRNKKGCLKATAFDLKFNLGIIAGTRLLDEDAEKLRIPGYRIKDKKNRSKHKGGC